MPNAKIGYGTLFSIQSGSPLTYNAVAEIMNVTPPGLSRDPVEATHNQSTEKWREYIPGLKDGGEVTFEMNFIPSGAGPAAIIATFNSDNLLACKVTFPDSPATEWTFSAICTAFEPEAPTDDRMTASATFKVSGKPTFVGA